MTRPLVITWTFGAALLLSGCGENTINNQDDEFGQQLPVNPFSFIPEIPRIRWSAVSYIIDGIEIEAAPLQPDPNWLSNDFLTDTLFSPDQNIAGVMDCQTYRYEYEFTSTTTIRLGVGEALGEVPECVLNLPEGLLRSVFADFENVLAEGQADGTIDVTNGNGTVVTLKTIEF